MTALHKSALLPVLLLALLSACALNTESTEEDAELDAMRLSFAPPLAPLGTLNAHASPNEEIERIDRKEDDALPVRFDLLATQSPVRDQGSRGTCVAHAIVALAEHFERKLYRNAHADFSEQYLYWLTHSRQDGYGPLATDRVIEGSDAYKELLQIREMGVPDEAVWPYEFYSRSTPQYPECAVDSAGHKEAACWTNGSPPSTAYGATMHRLGEGRQLARNTEELRAYIAARGDPVAIAFDVSMPIINAATNFEHGYITLPSDADSVFPSGSHEVLVVGWDDNMRVQRVNASGLPEFGNDGSPVYDTGFFLFKNQWGTFGWGRRNSARPGYGWMSYRYFLRFVTDARAAEPGPAVSGPAREDCANGIDDDHDAHIDCADNDCSALPSCVAPMPSASTFTGSVLIPDNDAAGIDIPLVSTAGRIASTRIGVNITHSYSGDLQLEVVHPSGERAMLRDRLGGNSRDITSHFEGEAFAGMSASGTWHLIVRDLAAGDIGTLTAATLSVTECGDPSCAVPPPPR
jgi:C1A family cysteine protease